MKMWLVRLGLSLVLLGSAACSSPTTKEASGKPDPTVKPSKPPAPPGLPKNPRPDPNR